MTTPPPESNIIRQQLARQQNPGGGIPTPDVQGLRTSSPGASPLPSVPSMTDLQLEQPVNLPEVPRLEQVELPPPQDPLGHIAPVNPPSVPVLGNQHVYDGLTYTQLREDEFRATVPNLSPRQSLTDLALNVPNDVWNTQFDGTRRAFGRGLLEGLGSIFNWEAQAGKEPIGTIGPVLGAIDFYAEQLGFQAPFGNRYGWNFGEMGAGPIGALLYHLGIIQNTAQGLAADAGREIGAFTYGISGSLSGNVRLQDFFNIGSEEYVSRVNEFYRLTEDGEYLSYTIRALRGDRLGFSNFTYNENNRFQPYAFMGDAEDFDLVQRSDRDFEILRRREEGEPPSPETLPPPPDGREYLRMQRHNMGLYGRAFVAAMLDMIIDPVGPFNNLARSISSRQSRALAPVANTWRPPAESPIPDNFPSYRTPRLPGGPDVPRTSPPTPPAPRRITVEVLPDEPLRAAPSATAPRLRASAAPPDVPAAAPGLYNNRAVYQQRFVPDMPEGITVEVPSVPGFDVSQAAIPQPRHIAPQASAAFAPQLQFADAARYAASSRVARLFDLRRVNLATRSPSQLADIAQSYGVPANSRTVQHLLPSVEDAALRRHLQHTTSTVGVDVPSVPPARYVVPLDAPTLRAMTGRIPRTFSTRLSESIAELSRESVPTANLFQTVDLMTEAFELEVSSGNLSPGTVELLQTLDIPSNVVPVSTTGMSGASFFANDTSFFKVYPADFSGRFVQDILAGQSRLADAPYVPQILSSSPRHVEFARIDGTNLSTYMMDNPDVDMTPVIDQLVDIFDDMAARDLVLMDISLNNMMVDTSGKLWLIDLDTIDDGRVWRNMGQPNIMTELLERATRALLLRQPENRAAKLMRHALQELLEPSQAGTRAAYPEYRNTLPPEYTVPDEPDEAIISATREYVIAQNNLEEASSKLSEMEAQLHEATNVQNRPPTEGYFAQGIGSGARLYRNADGSVSKHIPLERWTPETGAEKVAQLHEEFDLMARLQHLPFVPRVYEKTASGYTMEFIEGRTAMELYGNNMPLLNVPEPVIRRIAEEMPRALRQMADANVLYYDLHGGNLMILPDGSWKLIDFGDATLITGEDVDGPIGEVIKLFNKFIARAVDNEPRRFEIEGMPKMYEHRRVDYSSYEEFLEAWGGEEGVRNALQYAAGRRTFLNALGDFAPLEAARLQKIPVDAYMPDEVLGTMEMLLDVKYEDIPTVTGAKSGPVFTNPSAAGVTVDIGQGRLVSLPEGMTKAIADAVPLDAYDEVAPLFGGRPVPIQEFMARGEVTFMEAYMKTLARKKFPGVDIHVVTETNRETAYAYYTLLQGIDSLPDAVTAVYIGRGAGSLADGTWHTTREGVTYLWQEIVDDALEPGERALVLSGSTERALVPEQAQDMWVVLQAGKDRPVLLGSGNFFPSQAGDGATALMEAFRRYNANPMDEGRAADLVEQIRYELEELTKEMYTDALEALEEYERAERALRDLVTNKKRAMEQWQEESRQMAYRQRDIELGSGNRQHCL